LVATIQSTGAAQSTIKLVATNLIANGNVWEGVQLLCLIGKGLDACRYLISYGLWEAAVWLAKSVLPTAETHEVMRKWTDHLWVNGHKVGIINKQHYKMCKDATKTFVFMFCPSLGLIVPFCYCSYSRECYDYSLLKCCAMQIIVHPRYLKS
jgi:hypothetical protein